MPLAGDRSTRWTWGLVLLGFAAMFGQTYWRAAHTTWQSDDNAHGVIVLAVVAWLFWRKREELVDIGAQPARIAGWASFLIGALLYVAGRAVNSASVEFFSQIPVVLGVLLVLKGWPAVRIAAFPLFYMIFMVPLPNILVDAVTAPLKQWISLIVTEGLYAVGYPISRTGVIISVGQYQLLVADACSGLHSMFSLSALGTLFMYLMGRTSRLHNALMLVSILPIAFAANIIRVVVLVLITYHFGDEAGQGFLHGAAGMVLMLVALSIFFLLDGLLDLALRRRRAPPAAV